MSSAYHAAKNQRINLREWIALTLFFSVIGALITIAYLTKQKGGEEGGSKLLIEQENQL